VQETENSSKIFHYIIYLAAASKVRWRRQSMKCKHLNHLRNAFTVLAWCTDVMLIGSAVQINLKC